MFALKVFLDERNKAFTELDMQYAARMMPTASIEVRLIAMHKARHSCLSIDESLRQQSGAWLKHRGYKDACGFEITDELPK